MATQEEMSKGISQILKLATDLLDQPDYLNINFLSAQNLVRQAFFKYLNLSDCPFRKICIKSILKEGGKID